MTDIRDALYIPGFGFDCSRTRDQSLGSAEADFVALMERAQAAREAREKSEADFSRRELTGEELGELAGKYAPDNMTQEEYDALLEELVERGVLKKSELTSLGYRGMVLLGQVDSDSFRDIESWRRSLQWAVRANPLPVNGRCLEDFEGDALAMAKLFSRWELAVESNEFLAKRYAASTALLNVLTTMQEQRQELTAGEAYSIWADHALRTSDPNTNTILPTDSTEVKLEKLRRFAEAADYTGMSYGEIYKTVLDRYQQAFGERNMLALISGFVGGSDRDSICHQFAREMDDAVYHTLWQEIEAETGLRYGQPAFQDYWYENYRFELGAEALGYGGMSPEEIEKAVAEKYAGRNTLADFSAMMYELRLSGVLDHKLGRDGANSLMSTIGRNLYEVRPEDNYDGGRRVDSLWERAQREPFGFQNFAQELKNTIQNNMSFYNYDFDMRGLLLQSLDQLMAMFGEGVF